MTQSKTNDLVNNHRIESLEGARFLAITMIVFGHFEFLYQYGKFGEVYWNFFHNPTMGVDFFFLLSGFGLMLSSIRRDPEGTETIGGIFGLINYGKKHIKKIYPVYVAFLLSGIPLFLIKLRNEKGYLNFNDIANCIIKFLVDLTLLQSGTGYSEFSHSLNAVCWFLSSLFCIYLISPIIMKAIKHRVRSIKSCFVCLIICIFISYLFSILFNWIENRTFFNELCYASPYRRVFYVISGMFIAKIYNTYESDNSLHFHKFIDSGKFEYVFICLSILWFFLRYSFCNFWGNTVYIFDMIIVFGDLFALAVSRGKISKFFSGKHIVFLGNISMYIFLSHYNIRMYIDLIVRTLHLESITVGIIEAVMILILTIAISLLIHHFRTSSKAPNHKR